MDVEMTSTSSSTLPKLPAELIEHIIRLSLPPLAFSTFRARYDLLLAYSTVSSVWHEAAQAELYSQIWLGDMETEDLLWQLIGMTKKGWTNRTRSLWCGYEVNLDDRRVYSAHFVDRALSYCPNVELVCLSALGLTPFDFSAFDHIKELRCSWIELYGTGPEHIVPRPPNPLPNLTRLALISPYLNGGLFGPWSNLLSPTTLPNLRHLALQLSEEEAFQDHNEEYDSLPNALLSLGPQLETLQFLAPGEGEIAEDIVALLPELTSLRSLRLCATESWCSILDLNLETPKLPPSLETLTLDPNGSVALVDVYDDLISKLTEAVNQCPALRTVALVDSWIRDMEYMLGSKMTPEMLEQYLGPLGSMLAGRGKRLALYRYDGGDEWWQTCDDKTQPGYYRELEEF
ncbi:hypothetical protein BCR35DRAFT_305596 [Leucosporidium creatinivorum]|uniref:F-box domain-containing protein n=1 Tax=Leucosporidium creatinivorum TaxID=106004 RepID=A0A1Y2EYY6_9BASI|nr:hypothetical protein BCR35DRAFT_305596 [Leucosporidium creatinivorum]